MLERVLTDPHDESLLGDLLEQFADGRSRLWFWRQTVVACGLGIAGQVSAHKWLSARALATGWALYFLTATSVIFMLPIVDRWMSALPFVSYPLLAESLAFLAHGATGWAVARFHRPHAIAMLSLFCVTLLVQQGVAMTAAFVFTPPRVPLTGAGLWLPPVFGLTRIGCAFLGGLYGAGASGSEKSNRRFSGA
jgi:hypothetical protein